MRREPDALRQRLTAVSQHWHVFRWTAQVAWALGMQDEDGETSLVLLALSKESTAEFRYAVQKPDLVGHIDV
jgi:hypothetical protein